MPFLCQGDDNGGGNDDDDDNDDNIDVSWLLDDFLIPRQLFCPSPKA